MIPGKRLLREALRHRDVPHVIGMVADQAPTSSAGRVWLRFLGRDTAFFPGPAEVARLGGYRAYFLALRRVRRGVYEVRFEPLAAAGENLDVPAFTARYAARLEAQIRAFPADWAWTHRRWKLQPPAEAAGPPAAPRA
jgi:KDO2-lipid IV(A) lauroyltransferase